MEIPTAPNGHLKASEKTRKNKKGKKKGSIDVSPEYIAQVRAERQAAREAKREALLASGLDPNCPPELRFLQRPMLELHRTEPVTGFVCKIMTYNCLAQALIRRKLFPDSGDALKWFRRSKVLMNEFRYYDPDVLCLQEVDTLQYQSFWRLEFENLGYDSQFYKIGTKNHGISILWKRKWFQMTDKMLIEYDKEISPGIEPRTTTKNAGMILALKFTDHALAQTLTNHKCRTGLIVGTTHLFWHPFGTYERTRQCYVVLSKMQELLHRVNVLQNNNDGDNSHWYSFLCGDFNSQPYDTPYLSMTSKPVQYNGRAETVISCSTSYKFSKLRDGDVEETVDEEEGGNIEKFGKDQPQDPVPQVFDASDEQKALVLKMASLHNTLPFRAISLYSVGYHKVHPENSGIDNARKEPEISNWAHTWRGLLDYIFLVKAWDFDNKIQVDSIDIFEKENGLRLRGFLRMPPAKEMTSHGQPHTGEYPSDHLAMMCKLELNV